ncbi:hypothetical protein LXL04_022927 [Taraxacum kok-saghyz]
MTHPPIPPSPLKTSPKSFQNFEIRRSTNRDLLPCRLPAGDRSHLPASPPPAHPLNRYEMFFLEQLLNNISFFFPKQHRFHLQHTIESQTKTHDNRNGCIMKIFVAIVVLKVTRKEVRNSKDLLSPGFLSGTDEALEHAGSVLSALSEKLYVIKGGCGAGSGVKMVNQLLAGVHIASAAEAMAFGARLGLDTRMLFDVLKDSEGTSWMFENRGPHMVDNDYTPLSALDIFVKDLGIVARECASRKVPLHISTVALQLFLSGSASGWGRLDDSAVVKVYETLTGVKVEGKVGVISKTSALASLPSEWEVDPLDEIRKIDNNLKTLVVLDDDPLCCPCIKREQCC